DGPRGRGGGVARARQAGAALRPAPLPVLQPGPGARQATRDPRGDPRAGAGPQHRAPLRDRPARAAPPPRAAQLTAIPLPFYANPLLFGHDPTPGLLAFRPSETHVTAY